MVTTGTASGVLGESTRKHGHRLGRPQKQCAAGKEVVVVPMCSLVWDPCAAPPQRVGRPQRGARSKVKAGRKAAKAGRR